MTEFLGCNGMDNCELPNTQVSNPIFTGDWFSTHLQQMV